MIRHAEAEGNIHRRAHGHYEGQITTRGLAQIELLKRRFINERIDAVYASYLTRAQVTATALSEPRGLNIITTEKLCEVCMGVWEDVAWGDIEHANPEMNKLFNHDPARWAVSESEPYYNVVSRMTSFIEETAQRHDGETVALFSHGFAIRSFLCNLMGYKSEETRKLPYADNTATALLIFDRGVMTIEYHGDNSHLNDDTSTFARQRWWRAEKVWKSENLRYLPLDESRDSALTEMYRNEIGDRGLSSKEYTAFLGEETVGFVGLWADSEKPGHLNDEAGWISSIYVKPEFRGDGCGAQLLGVAISEFRKSKTEYLRIETPLDDHLVIFFNYHGFEEVEKSGDKLIFEKRIRNW